MLAAEHASFLGDPSSPLLATGWSRLIPALLGALPEIEAGARSGDGTPFSDYGTGVVQGFDRLNGPSFRALLPHWIDQIGDVSARLHNPLSTIVDVGCGAGAGVFVLARAFASQILGIDADPAAIQAAKEAALQSSEKSRVRFEEATAAGV